MEERALGFLLRGTHPDLGVLREQVERAILLERAFSGVGFFLDFELPSDVPRLAHRERVVLTAAGERPGGELGILLLLFIDDGAISMLEGCTVAEGWPASTDEYRMACCDNTFSNIPENPLVTAWMATRPVEAKPET